MPSEKTKAAGPPGDEAPSKLLKCADDKDRAQEDSEKEVLRSRAQAPDIPDARFVAEVQSLLVGVDLTSMTLGELRSRLEGKLGLAAGTLASRKTLRRRFSFLVHQEVLKKSQRSNDCERIVKEILRLEDCPKTVQQMLIDSLHHSLSLRDATGLHPHQVRLLDIVRDALSEGKAKLECTQQRCKEKVAAAQTELRAKEADVTTASSEAAAASEAVQRAEATSKETESEVAEMQKDVTDCADKAKAVIQETQKMEKQLTDLVEVQKRLECMAQGLWSCEEEWWECFAALQQHLLDTGAECSLLTAATVSLKKRPAERSDFDAIAVEGVGSFLCEQRRGAEEELLARPQLQMEAEAATLSRRSLLSATEQRAIEHLQALQEAKAAQEISFSLAAKAAAALPASEAQAKEYQKQEAESNERLESLNEALQLICEWICGSSKPGQCEAPLEVQELKEEAAPLPVAKELASSPTGPKDVEAKILDLKSPLRVPTPMKGRLST